MKKRGLKTNEFIAPASLLKRFLSYFIDLFIINFIIILPFEKILKNIIPSNSFSESYQYIQNNPGVGNLIFFLSIIIGILMVVYFTVFEYLMQQTPGKILMKQYIIKETGQPLKLINYIVSNLTFIPIFPFILLWIIDPIHMIISSKNQRLMERFTRILVVEKYSFK
ncbi:RDD family protein [Candidatus Woesearchaeota archaeon]|nr:RDD family protein [Candidatus Woesearchaeota archaeon]